MLILDVIEHETIWGGQRLLQHAEPGKKVGHLYSLITEDTMASKIMNGPHAGETFRDYFKQHKAALGMPEYDEFPFVIALVEACDDLSIQVHPDDAGAQTLEGQRHGKNESWFFLEAPTDGWLYNGCVCTSKEELRRKLDAAQFDGLADRLRIQAGDYIYVEAGTLHAITRGALLYEIEENCSLTYRFYDFNRRDDCGRLRDLHIEKAFHSIDLAKKSAVKAYQGATPIEESSYSTQRLTKLSTYENTGAELACLTLIDGGFSLNGIEITPGISILVLPGERFPCDIGVAMIARPKRKGDCYKL